MMLLLVPDWILPTVDTEGSSRAICNLASYDGWQPNHDHGGEHNGALTADCGIEPCVGSTPLSDNIDRVVLPMRHVSDPISLGTRDAAGR